MARKTRNFDHAGDVFARDVQRQFAELNKAVRSLRDNMAGLHRALHAPVPKGGSRYTKSVRSYPSIFVKAGVSSLGNFFAGGFLSDVGLSSSGSFYPSQSQMTSQFLDLSQQAQRNR